MIDFAPKDPTEVVDYLFDWTGSLQDGEGIASEVTSVTGITLDDSGVVNVDPGTANGVRVWLSGGTEGSVARVTCTITTDSTPARTFAETAIVPIGGGPVSLAKAKAHLRVDFDNEDALIRAYLSAAVSHVEKLTGRVLSPRVEEVRLDAFPLTGSQRIVLPRDPVQEIVSLTYLDQDAASVEMVEVDGEFRTVAGEPYLLFPELAGSWPAPLDESGAVRVRQLVGYEAGQVPAELTAAVLMMTAHLYQNREAVSVSNSLAVEVPMGVKSLCWPFRRNLIG
jgi:uncharacterized phiE125 gp8 family phage protein